MACVWKQAEVHLTKPIKLLNVTILGHCSEMQIRL